MVEINEVKSTVLWQDRHESQSMRLGNNYFLGIVEGILDPLVLVLTLWVLAYHFEGTVSPPYIILSIIIFFLTFPGATRLRLPLWKLISNIVFQWFCIAALLLAAGLITEYINNFSTTVIVNWLWFAPLSQIGGQLVLKAAIPQLLKLQGPPRKAVVVGMNKQSIALAKNIEASLYCDIDLMGFFEDRGVDRRGQQDNYQLLGRIENLAEYVKKHRVQLIYLSLPMTSRPRILEILDHLKDTTASIYFVPDMFITDLIQGHSDSVCGVNVISVCDTPFRGFNRVLKRGSDIVLSLFILVLIFPIMLLIALMVKLSSPGSVIFKQRRYGLDGEQILVYKFRSMAVTEDGGTIQQASKNDLRVTPLGAFLRRTSLDELPQFINVLQGRMSIVGPRPHAVAHNEMYRTLIKGYMVRHKVRPGITGWAQVNGLRGETATLDKMQARIDFDLDYLRNWSLLLDIFIILKTIRLVFKDSTAY